MHTKIIIDTYNALGNILSQRIIRDTQISGNEDIRGCETFDNPDGTVQSGIEMDGWDVDTLISQFFSEEGNSEGEYNRIRIESLSDVDREMFNQLFSRKYLIPDCRAFEVSPEVGLVNLPQIVATPEEDVCAICLEKLFVPGTDVVQISGNVDRKEYCKHKFHDECMRTYCVSKERDEVCTCPLCRKPFTLADVRKMALGGKRKRK